MARAPLSKRPDQVASMFDGIARHYDLVNDVVSLGQDRRWRALTVEAVAPQPGENILDLAAGTGTSSVPFATAGATVTPCDMSEGMVAEGKRRHPELNFVVGNATDLPFDDASFDAVTISFGLRNVQDTAAALREMLRVTRPGGRLVICEFSTPTAPWLRTAYQRYLMRALPPVAGWITRDRGSYDYLAETILLWSDQRGLAELIRDAGWDGCQVRNATGGIVALHRAWKPDVPQAASHVAA
ncbi:MAG: demethylmenaquinone methyltransferase [Cellulomonadaceae bacterium]|nr:demethylmenaquinone methyltransferase [Cellulomonadaceae bacterium]